MFFMVYIVLSVSCKSSKILCVASAKRARRGAGLLLLTETNCRSDPACRLLRVLCVAKERGEQWCGPLTCKPFLVPDKGRGRILAFRRLTMLFDRTWARCRPLASFEWPRQSKALHSPRLVEVVGFQHS